MARFLACILVIELQVAKLERCFIRNSNVLHRDRDRGRRERERGREGGEREREGGRRDKK